MYVLTDVMFFSFFRHKYDVCFHHGLFEYSAFTHLFSIVS